MRNLKVSMKLIVSFTIVIVLAVVIAVVGIWSMGRIREAADDMYNYNVVAIDSLGLIRENFALQRNTTRELVIYDAASEQYRNVEENLINLELKMDEYVSQYMATITTNAEKETFEQFLSVYYDIYMPYKDEFLQYTNRNGVDEVIELIQTRGYSIVSNISDVLQQAYDLNVKASKDALNRNADIYRNVVIAEVIVLAAAICIVIVLVIRITHLIATPLSNMAKALHQIGTVGDLAFDVKMLSKENVDRKDEIGMATRAILSLLNHIWSIDKTLSRISNGDFLVKVKTLSDRDTIGLSVSKVADNLNSMFNNLTEAEENAQAANNAKSVFLAHISHEIRTPLNAIMGMAMITKNAAGDREKTITSVNQIMSSSRHLLSILNDVLDMSKIESGKLELGLEPFHLHGAFDEALSIMAQRCSEKDIHFTSNVDQLKDMTLIGDKMRINQVLINLLGNAAKFTESSGKIKFLVDILEEDNKGIRLKYSVSDNGIGMSPEQLLKLFKPFEQGDSSTASKYGGTGLGLSISWNIVNMMGGAITVESEQGIGSTFSFELYLEKGEAAAGISEKANELVDLNGKRILLVEDVEINRLIICELLAPTNVVIDQAEDGKQAVEMFMHSQAGYYDLIFMDIQMPFADGYEVTGIIRMSDHPDAKNVPIIAMTANAYKEDVERALAVGMNGHLSKPIEMDVMMKLLQKHINTL